MSPPDFVHVYFPPFRTMMVPSIGPRTVSHSKEIGQTGNVPKAKRTPASLKIESFIPQRGDEP